MLQQDPNDFLGVKSVISYQLPVISYQLPVTSDQFFTLFIDQDAHTLPTLPTLRHLPVSPSPQSPHTHHSGCDSLLFGHNLLYKL